LATSFGYQVGVVIMLTVTKVVGVFGRFSCATSADDMTCPQELSETDHLRVLNRHVSALALKITTFVRSVPIRGA
jgi:hypothetical protein